MERFSQGDVYKRHLLKKQEIHAIYLWLCLISLEQAFRFLQLNRRPNGMVEMKLICVISSPGQIALIKPVWNRPLFKKSERTTIPRLSRKATWEWDLFLDPCAGRRNYNKLCRCYTRSCKQSFRTIREVRFILIYSFFNIGSCRIARSPIGQAIYQKNDPPHFAHRPFPENCRRQLFRC